MFSNVYSLCSNLTATAVENLSPLCETPLGDVCNSGSAVVRFLGRTWECLSAQQRKWSLSHTALIVGNLAIATYLGYQGIIQGKQANEKIATLTKLIRESEAAVATDAGHRTSGSENAPGRNLSTNRLRIELNQAKYLKNSARFNLVRVAIILGMTFTTQYFQSIPDKLEFAQCMTGVE